MYDQQMVMPNYKFTIEFNKNMTLMLSIVSIMLLILCLFDKYELLYDYYDSNISLLRFMFCIIWFVNVYDSYNTLNDRLINCMYICRIDLVVHSVIRIMIIVKKSYISIIMQNRIQINHDDYDDSDYGIDQEYINMLHKYKYIDNCSVLNLDQNNKKSKIDDILCCICLETYKVNDELRILNCNHHMHIYCCDSWLYRDNSCPICRSNAVEVFSYED